MSANKAGNISNIENINDKSMKELRRPLPELTTEGKIATIFSFKLKKEENSRKNNL